jgi:ribosomal protein S18 acetylase RimI-like enzyme
VLLLCQGCQFSHFTQTAGARLDKTRAQQQLLTNWVAIILAVLSIIQGLAFNNLVVQFPDIYQYSRTTGDIKVLIHFGLSFVLLLRVFQTYLTAALDYNPWSPNFFDVLIIFIVGALEYFLFSTLKSLTGFNVIQFHSRFSLISVLGMFGYLAALFRVREEYFPSYKDFRRDVRLQVINILGVALVLSISVLFIVFPAMSSRTQVALALISTLVLTANILFSLRITFAGRRDEGTTPSSAKADEPKVDVDKKGTEIFFRTPEREDVRDLVEIFVDHFGYFYSAIFDTSFQLTRTILKTILVLNGGSNSLGYKTFHLACDQKSGHILGFFALATKESSARRKTFLGFLGSLLVVLFQLGIVGLIRVRRNARQLGPFLPSPELKEMRIVYFAVLPNSRRHGVGRQMMVFIKDIAARLNKQSLTLEVRETNAGARQFFKSAGFTEASIIRSDGDAILNQGYRILMAADVSTEENDLLQPVNLSPSP